MWRPLPETEDVGKIGEARVHDTEDPRSDFEDICSRKRRNLPRQWKEAGK